MTKGGDCLREVLAENANLQLIEEGTKNQFDIVVGSVIGKGASCVVYDAVRVAGDKQYKIRLKQFNPLFSNYDVKRFEAGAKKNIKIQNVISNSTSKVFGVCRDENQNPFVIVDYDDGIELSKCNNISLLDFADVCKNTAIALKKYHELGWLHLDIKPSNILMINSDGMKGVKFFDFDSVIEKVEIECKDVVISCSQNYAAPEVLQNKRNRISEKSDFYSIGAMMFEFLFGRAPNSMDRSVVSSNRDFSKAEALNGINPKIESLLKTFLNKTIVSSPARRYDSDDELIDALQKIVEVAGEKHYLISTLPMNNTYFVGRENELAEIHKNLQESNAVFISGIGGIGKSELARAYVIKHKNEFSTVSFGVLVNDIMTFVNDDTIINIANYSNNGELTEEQYFGSKLIKLSSIVDKNNLIIVDNFENLDDNSLDRLLKLNCRFIFTTRDSKPNEYGYNCIRVAELSKVQLSKIFWNWYDREEQNEETDALAYELISLVHSHTLAVELLAKQMNASRINLKQMLDKLHENGLSNSGNEEIRYQKDGEAFHSNAIGVLKDIISLADLSKEKQQILLNLAMLPSAGISDEIFKKCYEFEDFNEVNELEELGWIKAEGGKITLHPLIAEVILASVEVRIDDVKVMLDNLSDRFDAQSSEMVDIANHTPFLLLKYTPSLSNVFRDCYKIIYKAMKLLIKRGMFDSAKALLEETTLVEKAMDSNSSNDWYMNAEWKIANICYILFAGMVLLKDMGEFYQAKRIFEFLSSNFLFCPTDLELETNYEYANIMVRQRNFKEAERLYKNIESILTLSFERDSIEFVRLNNETGIMLAKMGRGTESLEIHQKSLHILEKSNVSEEKIADIHRRLAYAYYSIGEYENAIKEYNKALQYNDTTNIYSYIYRFECYGKLKDFDSFEKEKNAALAYCQKEYGEESYFYERIICHLIDAYIDLKEYKKATEAAEQAFELELKLFNDDSYNIARGYYNLAKVHYYMKKYSEAESFIDKTYDILLQHYKQYNSLYASCSELMAKIYAKKFL